MKYCAKRLASERLGEIQSQLHQIENDLPPMTELIPIAEEYEKSPRSRAILASLMTHISHLKVAQTRYATLFQEFEKLKPVIFESIDETEDEAENLAVNVAFDIFFAEQERFGIILCKQERMIRYLIGSVQIDTCIRKRFNEMLDAASLSDFAKSLKTIQ